MTIRNKALLLSGAIFLAGAAPAVAQDTAATTDTGISSTDDRDDDGDDGKWGLLGLLGLAGLLGLKRRDRDDHHRANASTPSNRP
jgi:MYXO-CTERM domain-containing protein